MARDVTLTQNAATTSNTATRVVEDTSQMTMNGQPFNNAQTQQQQQQTQYNSVEEYIQAETNRILADSTAVNDEEIVDYEWDNGWRARTNKGNLGARRKTKEEAAASAVDSFQIGQKVAETDEQVAQLRDLAVQAKHYGGRDVNAKMLTDVMQKAMPNSTREQAFFRANNIRPAVDVDKNGRVYTAYGDTLDVAVTRDSRDREVLSIVSPEGVLLTRATLTPEIMMDFGLSAGKVLSAYDKLIRIQGEGAVSRPAFLQALQQQADWNTYQRLSQEQSLKPGGGTISTDGGPARTFTQEKRNLGGWGYFEGYDPDMFTAEEAKTNVQKQIQDLISDVDVYRMVSVGTRPEYNKQTYLNTLNQVWGTPNNNISLEDGKGLVYNFEDGTQLVYGRQFNNLPALKAMALGDVTGTTFGEAKNFNSFEEYESFRRTQTQDQEQRQTPAVQPPAAPQITPPPAPTTQVTQPVQPPTFGQQQQLGAQQPIALPTQTVTPPTGIQTPSGISGTFGTPLQTASISAVPQTITTATQTAGFTPQQLSQPSQQNVGVRTVTYANQLGQSIPVTESNGQPITFVPPGYTRQSQQSNVPGFNEGGSVESDAELDAMYRMATKFLGYRGPRSRRALEDFAKSSPGASAKMKSYTAAMAKGGMVRKGYQEGGVVSQEQLASMSGNLMQQTFQPIQAPTTILQPQELGFIPTTAGQAAPQAPMTEAATVGTAQQVAPFQFMTPATFTAQQAAPQVAAETAQLQAAQGQVSQQAQVQAAQQQGTAVSGIEAAQGTAILMDNPVQREIQQGELISGSAVDATKVTELNSQLQAAQATPTAQATVQGQLEGLMAQFEGGQTPAWAAGAMRSATAMLSARGLGASSLAGQAVVQAAMESALPIAQMDAQTRAQFESQNLSNRQQTAMMAAQQRAAFLQLEFDQEFQSRVQNASRIADIANMNFTAEQQVALENSRIANTTNLQNLSNRQAKVMAEAAALANLDMANLNNRQQAAVQNAQAFLQMDLTNLSNEQQTGLFRAQQNIQALFTDQAAENAALQFNAASENQTNQFFSNLNAQVSQFNATQQNAMDQFNVNSINAMRQFNSEVQQQRDLFNAQNGLVIAQANAQWRQNIATLNNATQNQSNMEFARTINALTSTNLDQIWQRERDIMNYAFTQSETSLDRALSILLADKELDAYREKMAADENNARFALGTSLLLGWD